MNDKHGIVMLNNAYIKRLEIIVLIEENGWLGGRKMKILVETGQYDIPWLAVGKRFALWLLSIPINLIPILLKYIAKLKPQDFHGISSYFASVFSDLDITFIVASVLFVLCIEGYFTEAEVPQIYKKFQLICLIYFTVTILLYKVFTFRNDLFGMMSILTAVKYNLILILLTVILGFFCTVSISLEKSEAKL